MNKNIARGLALAALTGGFTILGATAANAIDLPDLDGLDGTGSILDLDNLVNDLHVPVTVDVPVVVDGLNVSVLDHSTLVGNDVLGQGVLGNGVVATTGKSTVDVLAALGIDTSGLLGHSERLTTVVGVPVDLSNTWLSIFGNKYNGIVVVPNLSTTPAASITDGVDGLIDAFVTAPIDVSCSSVTVLSDYENGCAGGESTGGGSSSGGVLDGDLLGDGSLDGDIVDGNLLDGELINDVNGDGEITVEDRQLGVLDGDTIDDPVLDDHGVLVEGEDYSTDGFDLSPTWLSVFGGNDGVVVVPDLTLDAEKLTKGLVSHELLAPIVIDCVTITVVSDYERACTAGPTDPTDPTVPNNPTNPTTPVVGGGNGGGENGGADNGGTGDPNGDTDLCAAVPASASLATDSDSMNLGALAAAALAGALLAMLLMLAGRRMGRQQ